MIFLLLIILASLSAYLAVRKMSFYSMWQLLFSIMFSVYIAIMSAPMILRLLSDDARFLPYSTALGILLIAFLVFVLLYAIFSSIIGPGMTIRFPRICDPVGVGILGFLAGYIVCSFLLFAICIMPITRKPCMNFINGTNGPKFAFVFPVHKACAFVNSLSLQSPGKPSDIINGLLEPDFTVQEDQAIPKSTDTPAKDMQTDLDAPARTAVNQQNL